MAPPPKPPAPVPAAAMVRGKAGPKAAAGGPAPPPAARTFSLEPVKPHPEEKATCPLCIEELDQTDLSFEPCPCGYRICLFCFEKLKLLCSSSCPNCRRVYGSEEAAEFAKMQQQRAREAEEKQTRVPRTNSGTSGLVGAGAPGPMGKPPLGGPVPKPPATQQYRKPPETATPVKRGNAEETPSLPSGATWGSPSLSRHQSVEIERPAYANGSAAQASTSAAVNMDTSSWPSLADQTPPALDSTANFPTLASTIPPPMPSTSKASKQKADEQAGTRRTNSMASSNNMDRVASSASLEQMSQDPPITPEQLQYLQQQHQQYQQQHSTSLLASTSYGNLNPTPEHSYFTAQVHTTVNGIRRNVNVPLQLGSSGPVEPYPEAPGMLANMQAAVKAGTANSKDAASQLLALLKQKEAQEGRARAPLTSKPAPPGFGPAPIGPPAASASQNQQPYSALVNGPLTRAPPPGFGSSFAVNQSSDSAVVPGPSASTRCTPIQPPGLGGLANGYGGKGGLGGGTGTYSLWSGLPGIDLGGSNLSSIWSNGVSTSYQPLHSALVSNAYGIQDSSNAVGNTSLASKAPPPGFGNTAPPPGFGSAGAGDDAKNSYRPYQPLGATARYNPLEFASTTTAYRPQL